MVNKRGVKWCAFIATYCTGVQYSINSITSDFGSEQKCAMSCVSATGEKKRALYGLTRETQDGVIYPFYVKLYIV